MWYDARLFDGTYLAAEVITNKVHVGGGDEYDLCESGVYPCVPGYLCEMPGSATDVKPLPKALLQRTALNASQCNSTVRGKFGSFFTGVDGSP